MVGSSADFDGTAGLGVSPAGEARPNSEADVDEESAGFDSEPNKLLLDDCEDGAVPAA